MNPLEKAWVLLKNNPYFGPVDERGNSLNVHPMEVGNFIENRETGEYDLPPDTMMQRTEEANSQQNQLIKMLLNLAWFCDIEATMDPTLSSKIDLDEISAKAEEWAYQLGGGSRGYQRRE